MNEIVVFGKNGPFVERVRDAADRLVISIWPGSSERAVRGELSELDAPALFIVADEIELSRAFDVANIVRKTFAEVPIVLSTEMSEIFSGAAKRAGVSETVEAELSDVEIRKMLDRHLGTTLAFDVDPVLTPAKDQETISGGRVSDVEPDLVNAAGRPATLSRDSHRTIVVVSPKGGVGKTTLSVNLAVHLSSLYPMQTVLLDYEDQFGDAASALNVPVTHSVDEAFLPGGGVRDSLVVKGLLGKFQDRLFVLAASDSPAAMEKVKSTDASELVTQLADGFPFVVIDTSAGITDLTLAALEVATDAVFVTTMDLSSIRAVRRSLDILARINLLPAKVFLIINQADPEAGLGEQAISKALGLPVTSVIPRSSEVVYSINTGKPRCAEKGPNEFKSAMRDLVDALEIGGAEQEEARSTSRFQLGGRK